MGQGSHFQAHKSSRVREGIIPDPLLTNMWRHAFPQFLPVPFSLPTDRSRNGKYCWYLFSVFLTLPLLRYFFRLFIKTVPKNILIGGERAADILCFLGASSHAIRYPLPDILSTGKAAGYVGDLRCQEKKGESFLKGCGKFCGRKGGREEKLGVGGRKRRSKYVASTHKLRRLHGRHR